MKYDDASWHYEGTYPKDLPDAASATHIGMFLNWMVINDRVSEALLEDAEDELGDLKERSITGAQFVLSMLDERITDQEFDKTGNAFALAYYQGLENDSRYIDDYFQAFGVNEQSLYRVDDTWANYDKLAGLIDARYKAWDEAGRPEYIV